MSEFEYFEMINMSADAVRVSIMNFTYLVFSYIFASYLAGDKFPKHIAIAASVIYTLALFGPLLGIVGNLIKVINVTHLYHQNYPEGALLPDYLNGNFALFITIAPIFLAWCSSIYFLHFYVRKDNAQK